MVQFTFSDLLLKAGIDPAKTKLIRHSFSSWHFRECFNRGLVKEYTAEQKQGFSKGYDYWAVFTSDKGSLSRFYTLYKVNGSVPNTPDLMPENWPIVGSFQGTGACFNALIFGPCSCCLILTENTTQAHMTNRSILLLKMCRDDMPSPSEMSTWSMLPTSSSRTLFTVSEARATRSDMPRGNKNESFVLIVNAMKW